MICFKSMIRLPLRINAKLNSNQIINCDIMVNLDQVDGYMQVYKVRCFWGRWPGEYTWSLPSLANVAFLLWLIFSIYLLFLFFLSSFLISVSNLELLVQSPEFVNGVDKIEHLGKNFKRKSWYLAETRIRLFWTVHKFFKLQSINPFTHSLCRLCHKMLEM